MLGNLNILYLELPLLMPERPCCRLPNWILPRFGPQNAEKISRLLENIFILEVKVGQRQVTYPTAMV